MRALLIAIVPLLFVTTPTMAQIIRRGSFGAPPPAAWVSAGAAQAGGYTVVDGTTQSRWDFGSATQYQASIEKANGGVSFGLRGTRSQVPLRYSSTDPAVVRNVDADANVSQLLANVHVGGSRGFHSVFELAGGATVYSDFRARVTGDKLEPTSDTDFSFAFGGGFGYGFSNRFVVEVVQELITHLHQRRGLPANEDTNTRVYSTRIAGRLGVGSRR